MFIFKLATNLGDYWFIREAGVCNKFYNKIQILFPSLINYSQLLKEVNEMSPKHAPKTSMQTIQSSIFFCGVLFQSNKTNIGWRKLYIIFFLHYHKVNITTIQVFFGLVLLLAFWYWGKFIFLFEIHCYKYDQNL